MLVLTKMVTHSTKRTDKKL